MAEERSWTQLAAWLVAGALLIFGAWKLLTPAAGGGQGSPQPMVSRPAASGAPGRAGAGSAYVHVAGAVRRPGLYRLQTGSRIAAAIERAGGPRARADLAAVNLAARVQDGQQVVVPLAGAARATVGG